MPRWLLVSLIAAAAVVTAVGALLLMTGADPEDALSFLGEGAVVQLREELRPPRTSGTRVIVFAIDGVGDDEFREALASGEMPNIAALVGPETSRETYRHAYAPRGALSILPSTTYAAWTAVFTGEPVGRSGVSGNEWFDRETAAFVAPAPVSVTEHGDAARVYTESLMDRWMAVPTVFERAGVRSYVTLAAQHRGADLLIRPDAGMLADLVTAVAKGVGDDDEIEMEAYLALDRAAVESTLAAIEEHGLADLQVVYFPGIDLYTHMAEPALPEQRAYLGEVIDPAVGEILAAYDAAGVLDSTYVVFVSDHGHTPTLDTNRHALGTGEGNEADAALEAAGFRVRPLELETDREDFQAVLAYQGAFAYLYLADRSVCAEEGMPCDWHRPPRFEEDVVPVLRALDRANRDGQGAPKLRGTLDLVFAREARGTGDALPFLVWDGERLVPVGEYLAATPRPDLLDLEARLEALGTGPYGHRAGDVLVLSRSRAIDPIEDRFYFSARYRSWHGSPSAQDSEILWLVARPGASGEALRERARAVAGETPSQLHITPLVLELLRDGPSD
jgi:hypothetical protein